MAGAAGGVLGGIAGMIGAQPSQSAAQNLLNQAGQAYGGVNVPTDLANKLYLQQYASAGNLTPAQEQAINASPSQAAATQANPALVNAQMQALQGLKTASNTGMTPATRAALNQIQQQAAIQSQGQQQAVMQQFAQRGQAGSGNQLLAQLSASQNATNQANQQGTQAAGQASQNALSALGQYGGQAGAMNQQQFGQQFQTGTAADQLNRFNVQNQVNQQARNVAQQNAANQYNLQNQQGISNANVGQANAEQQRELNAQQQMFSDQLQKAGGMSGADINASNAYNNMGQQIGGGIANIGQGIGNLVGTFGGGSTESSGPSADQYSQMLGMAGYADGGQVTPYGGGGQTYDVGGTVNEPQVQSYNPLLGPATQHYDDGGNVNQSPTIPNWQDIIKQYMTAAVPQVPSGQLNQQSQPEVNAARGITIPNPNMNNAPSSLMGMMKHGSKSTMPAKSAGLPPPAPPPRNPQAMSALAGLISQGGRVPGKPMFKGDTVKNDVVSARLSPGEIVLPNSVSQHPNAPKKAAEFVEKEKAKQKE